MSKLSFGLNFDKKQEKLNQDKIEQTIYDDKDFKVEV